MPSSPEGPSALREANNDVWAKTLRRCRTAPERASVAFMKGVAAEYVERVLALRGGRRRGKRKAP